ncbi:MAG: LacI family transcriptional regulator [Bifidobacteriaceae bacterium]|jgi:DNA-binding LacI/PurR family transcriptional regulator|nr:LacI family transcriptional regulator [Bifidobacteriaceae bacterium]
MNRASAKVTIRDVARVADVSPSTVSRAFSRPDRVSAETTKRIFKVADELGYHSDPVETRPSLRRKGLVAIIVPDIANQFFSDIIRSVQRECFNRGVGLIVSESRESASWERMAFDKVVPNADGVILASSRMPDAMIRKCAQARPLVVVNRVVRGVPSIVIDVQTGVKQAIDHLGAAGYKELTYLDGPANSWSVGMRWKAIHAECEAHGIEVQRFWPGLPTFEGGYAFVEKYLRHPTGAVIAHNDMMAIGFIAGMRKRGFESPRDYSIIGFDDDIVGRISEPSISSIHMSLPKLGSQAERLLMQSIERTGEPPLLSMIPSSLIARESTATRSTKR